MPTYDIQEAPKNTAAVSPHRRPPPSLQGKVKKHTIPKAYARLRVVIPTTDSDDDDDFGMEALANEMGALMRPS